MEGGNESSVEEDRKEGDSILAAEYVSPSYRLKHFAPSSSVNGVVREALDKMEVPVTEATMRLQRLMQAADTSTIESHLKFSKMQVSSESKEFKHGVKTLQKSFSKGMGFRKAMTLSKRMLKETHENEIKKINSVDEEKLWAESLPNSRSEKIHRGIGEQRFSEAVVMAVEKIRSKITEKNELSPSTSAMNSARKPHQPDHPSMIKIGSPRVIKAHLKKSPSEGTHKTLSTTSTEGMKHSQSLEGELTEYGLVPTPTEHKPPSYQIPIDVEEMNGMSLHAPKAPCRRKLSLRSSLALKNGRKNKPLHKEELERLILETQNIIRNGPSAFESGTDPRPTSAFAIDRSTKIKKSVKNKKINLPKVNIKISVPPTDKSGIPFKKESAMHPSKVRSTHARKIINDAIAGLDGNFKDGNVKYVLSPKRRTKFGLSHHMPAPNSCLQTNMTHCIYSHMEGEEASVRYTHCQSVVFRPTWADQPTAPRHQDNEKTPVPLFDLDYVYGLNPMAGIHELGATQELVYAVATLVVLYEKNHQRQRFYREHNEEVTALRVHPMNGRLIASAQSGCEPRIHVWEAVDNTDPDLLTCTTLSTFWPDHKKVTDLDFSHDGKLLVSLCGDEKNTIQIWDWRHQESLVAISGGQLPVTTVKFNPYQAHGLPDSPPRPGQAFFANQAVYTLVSCGARHIKFWTLTQVLPSRTSSRVFSRQSPLRIGKKTPCRSRNTSALQSRKGRRGKRSSWREPQWEWQLEGCTARLKENVHFQDILCFDFIDDSGPLITNEPALFKLAGTAGCYTGISERSSGRVIAGTRKGDIFIFKQPPNKKRPIHQWWLSSKILEASKDEPTKHVWEPLGVLEHVIPHAISDNGIRRISNEGQFQQDQRLDDFFPEIKKLDHKKQYLGPLAHQNAIFSIVYCKHNRVLITSGNDGVLKFWSVVKEEECLVPLTDSLQSSVELKLPEIHMKDNLFGQLGLPIPSNSYGTELLSAEYGNEIVLVTNNNCIVKLCRVDSERVWHQHNTEASYHLVAHAGAVSAVATDPMNPDHFVTVGKDRTILLWDIPYHSAYSRGQVNHPILSVGLDPTGTRIAVGLQNNEFVILKQDVGDPKMLTELVRKLLKPPKNGALISRFDTLGINCIRYSPCGNMIAMGSKDHHLYIHKVDGEYNQLAVLKGHIASILHLDWSTDGKFVQTNSQDREILYWEMRQDRSSDKQPRQYTRPYLLRDEQWHTWTCPLGWPVMGIWPKVCNGWSDITGVCRAHGNDILATADDSKTIRIFTWPCMKYSPTKTFVCHSSQVSGVEFTSDDSFLITTGGSDFSMLQWRCWQHT